MLLTGLLQASRHEQDLLGLYATNMSVWLYIINKNPWDLYATNTTAWNSMLLTWLPGTLHDTYKTVIFFTGLPLTTHGNTMA